MALNQAAILAAPLSVCWTAARGESQAQSSKNAVLRSSFDSSFVRIIQTPLRIAR